MRWYNNTKRTAEGGCDDVKRTAGWTQMGEDCV